jgi:hypothetical protein
MFADCGGQATIVASGQPLPTGNLRLSPSPPALHRQPSMISQRNAPELCIESDPCPEHPQMG